MIIWTPGDLDIVTRTVWGEARGESHEGRKAVVHVVINRTERRIGDSDHSPAATCVRLWQFSAWLEKDPNRRKMLFLQTYDGDYLACFHSVLEAIFEPDFTLGATHYHTRDIRPRWARGKTPCYKHGRHLFYNNIE